MINHQIWGHTPYSDTPIYLTLTTARYVCVGWRPRRPPDAHDLPHTTVDLSHNFPGWDLLRGNDAWARLQHFLQLVQMRMAQLTCAPGVHTKIAGIYGWE